jgi:hypothetical protein
MDAQGNTADKDWEGFCPASSVLAGLVSDRVFVIDERLRILCANKAFLSAFGSTAQESPCGRTLGEVTGCRHAEGGGCGSSEACASCGWFMAVGACVRAGAGEQECRILTRSGDAFDLAVKVVPSGAGNCYVCGLQDLYAPKRLRVLERSFFHDVTNLAAGIRGLCELADDPDSGQGDELRPLIHDSANKLTDAIERLRTLRVAENGELRLWYSEIAPGEVLKAVVESFREDASARHLEVVVEKGEAPPAFKTDREILTLVLGELALNAIEASVRGDRVTLSCSAANGRILFSVHNPAVLDGNVQAHVFERSFTTKGPGRGVGAYRAKMFTERFLKGTMGFISHVPEGTTFFVNFPLNVSESST